MPNAKALRAKNILRPELTIVVFLVLSLAAGVVLSRNFLDIGFLLGSTLYYTELGLIALCFCLLMTLGELDLSVAANMTLTACVLGVLYEKGVPMAALIPLGLLLGTLLALFNGVVVTVTGLPSLIITIATLSIYRGLSQVLVGDAAISGFPDWFLKFGKITIAGFVPLPLVILVIVAIVLEVFLKRNFWGRKISAIGLNSPAANYSGIKTKSMVRKIFALQGFFCGCAALLSISRLEVVKYSIGVGGEMDVVTMVLLGGTAFTGGRGSVLGTLAAFFIIVFIRTGMRLATISSYVQIAVLGVLLIVVIIISDKLNNNYRRYQ